MKIVQIATMPQGRFNISRVVLLTECGNVYTKETFSGGDIELLVTEDDLDFINDTDNEMLFREG